MPVNEPRINVSCDICGTGGDFELTRLANGSWDDRDVRPKLIQWGWKIEGEATLCPWCKEPEFVCPTCKDQGLILDQDERMIPCYKCS